MTPEKTTTIPVAKPIQNTFDDISKKRNREDKTILFATDADTSLRDFYWKYDRGLVNVDTNAFVVTTPAQYKDSYSLEEQQQIAGEKRMYELSFSNKGGLVMPIIIEWTYTDGSTDIDRIGVNVWRKNENKVVKTFLKSKEVTSIKIDPYRETADIDEKNNQWPINNQEPSKFKLFKAKATAPRGSTGGRNPMQKELH